MKLLSFTVVLSLALVALCVPVALAASGFSVAAGTVLYTYADPSSLSMFLPHTVSLPLAGQAAVSAAASSTLGGFVVVGSSAVAAFNVSALQMTTNFGSNYVLVGVAFVPTTERVVAVGVAVGTFANNVAFFTSENSGLTWATPQLEDLTEYNQPGSISFSVYSSYGIAALKGRIYATFNSGQTWTSVYSALTVTISKVAVWDSGVALATGTQTTGVSTSTIGLISTDAGTTWNALNLPSFTPSGATVAGIALVNASTWLIATTAGEVWRTENSAVSWNRTLYLSSASWTDIAYSQDWKVALVAGSYPLTTNAPGVLALSYDGVQWAISSPQPSVTFSRVVANVPSAPAPPSPSPSVSPSAPPSPSASPSASPTISGSPSPSPSTGASHSSTPSASPTHSGTPSRSPSASPSPSASHSVLPSASRSPTQSPSNTPSSSPSPSKHTASPTPSASPSKHTASPTPSASPSKHTASPSPTVSPSKGFSPSPSPSAGAKKDSSDNKTLALGLGLGLGLGGAVLLLAGVGGIWWWKKRSTPHLYHPINTDV